ncbi:MAG: tRNA (adenosine(37)-N6)-threonylcarbamoyltransferase complex ATPase subunit type 1 TsaE [Actinomycetota bacterium]
MSRSPEDTRAIATALAQEFAPGDVVALSGDLGAGKTAFVQGAAAALGVQERVTSPSFVLVREYQGRLPILHIDVYRLGNLQELVDLGYEEFLDPNWVVFIEWGDAVGPLLPPEYLQVELSATGPDDRSIELVPHGPGWTRRLGAVRHLLEPFAPEGSP